MWLFSYEGASEGSNVQSRGQNAEGTEVWAYVDVRPGAHMFYWLYYTYHPDGYENRPWILWLQVIMQHLSVCFNCIIICQLFEMELPVHLVLLSMVSILMLL